MRLELAVPLEVDSVHSFQLSVGDQTEKVNARVASCRSPGGGHPETFEVGLEFLQISASMWDTLCREAGAPTGAASK